MMQVASPPTTPTNAARAEDLLEALCAAHPKSAHTLRLVHRVCVEHRRSGSRDFSLSKIGELCSAQGGPSANYLRTKPAKRYCAVIRAAEKSCAPRSYRVHAKAPDVDDILEGLSDPTVRARVGILLTELHSLRREKRGFGEFAATSRTTLQGSPVVADEKANPGLGQSAAAVLSLSPLERIALEQAVDVNRLREWGWRVDAKGRVVVDKTGAVIFAAGFISAISTVLARSG